MPKVIRVGVDLSQGHCFSPRVALAPNNPNPDLFINGIPVMRVGDIYGLPHNCGNSNHTMGPAIEGSQTVFNQGLGLHGDSHKINCGDVADNGSPDVFIDEGGNSNPNTDGNTVGYSVGLPRLEYPFYKILIKRTSPYILGPKILKPTFYNQDNELEYFDGALPGDLYSPLMEEDTGDQYKDKNIPISASISPDLPSFLSFDSQTGTISFNEILSGVFVNFNLSYTITLTNYVGTRVQNIDIEFKTV